MSLTLRGRISPFRSRPGTTGDDTASIRITAAADARADLLVVIISPGRWALFDPNTSDACWLGEITQQGDLFLTSHGDGPGGYRFPEFRQALSYFMEYGFALSLGGSGD
jgi:hypothetical protein